MEDEKVGILTRYYGAWHDWRTANGELASYSRSTMKGPDPVLDFLQAKAERTKDRMGAAYLAVSDAIGGVGNPIKRKVLTMRYLQLDKYGRLVDWPTIAGEIGYSVQHTLELHREAVEEVKRTLEERGRG